MSKDIDERVNRGALAAMILLGAAGGMGALSRLESTVKPDESSEVDVDPEREFRINLIKMKAIERRQRRNARRLENWRH